MKRCSICGDFKSISEGFTKNKSRKDGLNSACKECHRKKVNDSYRINPEYYKEKAWRAQAKVRDAVVEYKTGKPCKDCSGHYHPWQMDFDHLVPGAKKVNVSRVHLSGSLRAFLEEIEKCDLVCANCHRDRTHRRLQATKL